MTGLLTLAGAVLIGVAVLGPVFYGAEILRALRRAGWALGVLRPPAPPPEGPPIDRTVADLRRLRREMARQPPGTPMALRRAVAAAYEDALRDACHAVGVPDTFSDLPRGTEREAEWLRVEHALEQRGVHLADG